MLSSLGGRARQELPAKPLGYFNEDKFGPIGGYNHKGAGFSGSPVCMVRSTAKLSSSKALCGGGGAGGIGSGTTYPGPQFLSWGALSKANYPFGASPFSPVKWDQELYLCPRVVMRSEFIHLSTCWCSVNVSYPVPLRQISSAIIAGNS